MQDLHILDWGIRIAELKYEALSMKQIQNTKIKILRKEGGWVGG